MSPQSATSPLPAELFQRPVLERTGPRRGTANFYRSESADPSVLGGVSPDSVEAAVVAAVRMAYKVAETQVDRSARLATRLREAGDRVAGPQSDRQALDATEQLVFKAMMSGLNWLEGFADGRGNPLVRAASAQYRLLGSLLGLTPSDEETAHDRPARPADQSRPAGPPRRRDEAQTAGRSAWAPPRIRHASEEPRPVLVRNWHVAPGAAPGTYRIVFYGPDPTGEPMEASLLLGARRVATLTLSTRRDNTPGAWKAAICDTEGLQVGYVEVEL
jgi:hypothetical protein